MKKTYYKFIYDDACNYRIGLNSIDKIFDTTPKLD